MTSIYECNNPLAELEEELRSMSYRIHEIQQCMANTRENLGIQISASSQLYADLQEEMYMISSLNYPIAAMEKILEQEHKKIKAAKEVIGCFIKNEEEI